MTRAAAALVAMVSLAGCFDGPGQSIDSSGLADADRVQITENIKAATGGFTQPKHEVTSRGQIDAIYHVISCQPSAWRRAAFDAPGLQWYVQFYRGEKYLGEYGVGAEARFLEHNGLYHSENPEQQRIVIEALHDTSLPPQ